MVLTTTPKPTTVRLDVTLTDLYQREGLSNLMYIPHYPSSKIDFGPSHPCNQKFHIHDVLYDTIPPGLTEDQRRSFAINFTIGQMMRFKFFLGNMDVLRICSQDCPPRPLDGAGADHDRSLPGIPSRVDPSQLPKRIIDVYVDDAQTTLVDAIKPLGKIIVLPFPHDWCAPLPHLVDPDRHYLFHSKAYLTRLPCNVPRQEVFKLDDSLMRQLRARPAPFVVKSTHGSCSSGTWVVKTEAERAQMLGALSQLYETPPQPQPQPQPQDDGNGAAGPTAVPWGEDMLVSEFIEATHNYCLHFFVGRTGRSAFLGVTGQALDRAGRWMGIIKYKKQTALKALFDEISASIAEALAKDGYIGPVGADILIDRSGKQWLIDLNPRINGGTPLCLVRQHLSVQRHFDHATVLWGVRFAGCAANFPSTFQRQLQSGQLIVLTHTAWRDVKTGQDHNACNLICGARTEEQLNAILDEIYDYCEGTVTA